MEHRSCLSNMSKVMLFLFIFFDYWLFGPLSRVKTCYYVDIILWVSLPKLNTILYVTIPNSP